MPAQKLDPRIIEKTRDALDKFNGNQRLAAQHLGIARSSLQRRIKIGGVKSAKLADPSKKLGRSLADFRSEHDKDFIVPGRIKKALETLGEAWEYETDFARLAGVGLADLGIYRDKFEEYYVVVNRSGKRAWSGSKATAQKMREMLR